MDERTAETVFWVIHLPMMVLFLVGMWIVFVNWLKGSVGEQKNASTGQKIGLLVRNTLKTIFSARLFTLIKLFVTEAWFNRRLYQNDRGRWLTHFLLLTGFILLMTLSGISALSDKVLIHFFHLEHVGIIGMWVQPDHPITALLNEIGAVMMTVGLGFFIIRRYIIRAPQLRTGPMDNWMVVGLVLILLTGWVAEVVRLSGPNAAEVAYFSFIGYPISLLFRGMSLPWETMEHWLYVIHGLLTSVIIVTIPFSKFMHVIAGAIVAIARKMEEEEHASLEKGASHVPA
jgi:nitrate reductase gamma subunit